MDIDITQDIIVEDDVSTEHGSEGDLNSVKFWVAIIIGSWYLVGFSKGLR